MQDQATTSSAPPPLCSPDEALRLVLAEVRPLPPCEVPAHEAAGLVLAEPVVADRDYPPFDRATMDGCAVRLSDAGLDRAVRGEVAAGASWAGPLPGDGVLEIMTGAPCPPGCEAVVPREEIVWAAADPASGAPARVTLPATIRAGQNIQPRGAEAKAGVEVLQPGTRVTPLTRGVLAAVGRTHVRVHPPPRVALLLTGDELSAGATASIRDSNGPMLATMLAAAGVGGVAPQWVGDAPEALRACLARLLAGCDVLVTSGGVSAGRHDLVPALLNELGVRTIFHKVAQKPGKPLLFGVRERASDARQLVFGLPGNPLASHLCFHRYVAPALRVLMGRAAAAPGCRGVLAHELAPRGTRTVFQLARVQRASGQAIWRIEPLPGKGSADIFRAATAQVLLRLEPGTVYPAGTELEFEWLDGV